MVTEHNNLQLNQCWSNKMIIMQIKMTVFQIKAIFGTVIERRQDIIIHLDKHTGQTCNTDIVMPGDPGIEKNTKEVH